MSTKTISTYISAGYTLAAQYGTLVITPTGKIGGTGLTLNHAATVDNYGIVRSTSGANGVSAFAAATIVNGSATDTTASIYGYSGVFAQTTVATVTNFGSITGAARFGDGVFIVAGGLVTNGAANDTGASIFADNSGVSADALATVVNFGQINGYYSTGVYLKSGGSLTNGSLQDKTADIFSHMGQGVDVVAGAATIANFATIQGEFGDGVVLGGGGVLTNGSAQDTAARITGESGILANQLPATVKNFGTIEGYSAVAPDAGVYLSAGGSVINGAAGDTKAVIEGIDAGVYARYGAASVANFGTIEASRNSGIYLAGQGGPASETVTNGSASDTRALIQGATDGVGFGRFGTLNNFGTIVGQGAGIGDYGVYISRIGAVSNGSVADIGALIQGYGGVFLDAGFVDNFGTIDGVGAGGAGVLLSSGGGVTNGSAGDAAALIEGHVGVFVGSYSLNATVTNFGTIIGAGGAAVAFEEASDVLVVEGGCAFTGSVTGGGGTLELDSGTGTFTGLLAGGDITVSGSMAATTFADFDTVKISVAARFASTGAVRLAVGQSVIDAGSLTLGGAKVNVVNAGLIETLGGTVTVNGTVTGAGAAIINGGRLDFASAFTQNVSFAGATGVLELARSQGYAGTISGFSKSGKTSLDLDDIAFVNAAEATFSGTASGGVLTVTDGTHTAHISLSGNYLSSSFVAAGDGRGGTTVHDPRTPDAPAQTHVFIAAMAGLGAGGPGLEQAGAPRLQAPHMLLAPRAAIA